jgi:tetratricopeptide (TPR) repeat protein
MFSTTNTLRFAMKIKKLKLIFVCFLAVSFLSFALPGFADNSTLKVRCVDSSGNPLKGVKVEVYNHNTDKDKDEKTNDQGEAEFKKLDDGVYRIYGHKEDFVPALYEPMLLRGSEESVTLKFEAGADKKLYFEDPVLESSVGQTMQQGLNEYKQKNFAEAEKLFLKSLDMNPSAAAALYYLSVAYLQQKKFDETSETLKKAIKIANIMKNAPSPVAAGQPNPYEGVVQSSQKLLKDLPALRGEDLLKQKKYDEAIAEFREAVKGDPQNATYHANLAIALTNAQKFDEALSTVEKAEQLKPGEFDALRKSIVARKENAEIDKAQAVMDEGGKLFDAGDYAGALKKYEEARSMLSEDKQAAPWLQVARTQAKLGQKEAAIASFNKAIKLVAADKVENFRNSFVQVYLDDKKFDDAVDILADPNTTGTQSPEEVLLTVADAYKSKEPELAEAAWERVLKINPENADVYYYLGESSYIEGKEQDSRTKEMLTKYLEIGKDPAKLENAKNMLVIVDRRSE